MKKAFFLDRDGVLNVEVDYLGNPDEMELLPGVPEALEMLHRAGFLAVVISNQGGIAKGLFTEKDTGAVHARMQNCLLRHSPLATLDAFFYCIHHPAVTGECQCRKPKPFMFEKAAADFDIDLSGSFMIGDRMSDLFAGRNAGCKESCLVLTGYGEKDREKAAAENFQVAADLFEAVQKLLKIR
ncbi:MAG: HAD family hydrolase [Lentisphaeria bacterium]|nr:HAD family hydrolase [Lentisphaeria bacterium]